MDEVEQDLRGFLPLVGTVQVVGVSLCVLMAVWTGHFLGGFAWQADPAHQFNWHPLLLTLGLVYLYGNGLVLYRVFRHERKRSLKIAHAAVLGSALVLAVVGVKAVWDSHALADPPGAQLYTLHSWLGLVTLIISFGQFTAGFVTFLWPGLASHFRSR